MKVDTRLFPNSSINEAIHRYSVEKSTPVSSNLDIHRQESEKWAIENSGMTAMFVHPLQVCSSSCCHNFFFGLLSACGQCAVTCDVNPRG